MVYHNGIRQEVSLRDYGNETFRARNGYKEAHAHDAPYRRSRDFKPTTYGSFKGLINYRHAEPFCLLKNIKDISREEHHHPIKWFKQIAKGALTGSLLGYCWFVGGNTGPWEMQKLMASVGSRSYSGKIFRMARHVIAPYAAIGGAAFLGYELIIEFMQHHDESNNRP